MPLVLNGPRDRALERKLDRLIARALACLALLCSVQAAEPSNRLPRLLISEFLSRNTTTLLDEDGDTSDWIEVFNPGDTSVPLEGWALADSPTAQDRWIFPKSNLGPKQRLIVFASGKNRRRIGTPFHTDFKLAGEGGYLGLFAPDSSIAEFDFGPSYPPQVDDVSFGIPGALRQTVLSEPNSPARFLVPSPETEPDPAWNETEFDDSNWASGLLPLGYESGTAEFSRIFKTNLRSRMQNKASGVRIRIRFQVDDPSTLRHLRLRARFDDGFVAWVNGTLAAEENAPSPPTSSSVSLSNRARDAALIESTFDITHVLDRLVPGINVLSVHALSTGAADPDFLFAPVLDGDVVDTERSTPSYMTVPTPGTDNTWGRNGLGPLVQNVEHQPTRPRAEDPLHIRALVTPTFERVDKVSLIFRSMFAPEVSMPMFDDGAHGDGLANDGVFGAFIPPNIALAGQMIRYAIVAEDRVGIKTRHPPFPSATSSPRYLGTVTVIPELSSLLPVLDWFIETPSQANNSSGGRASIYFQGQFLDNIAVNNHGQSSLSFPKMSYDFDLNPDHHLRWRVGEPSIDDFNLLTTYPDKSLMRNILSYEVFRDAGSAYHFVIPVRVQQNGRFFSVAHLVENGDDNYLRRLGYDPNGALYKVYNTLDSTEPTEKKTRKYESKADLASLIAGAKLSATARARFIFDHINVPEVVNYLAAMTITGGTDCCHKNFYVYRDTEGSGLWHFFPWDQDLTFGRNWTGDYFDDRMYPQNGLYVGSNNLVLQALFNTPAIQSMYLRRVRTLMDTLLQSPTTPSSELRMERRIAELELLMAPDATLDYAKWPTWGQKQTLAAAAAIIRTNYLPARRRFLFNTLGGGATPSIPASQPATAGVQIRGIDFNPTSEIQDQEYIEILNTNRFAIDISGWQVTESIAHTFRPGTVIPANGLLHLVADLQSFRQRVQAPTANQGLFVQGNYKGRLSARGGPLTILDGQGRIVTRAVYPSNPTPAQRALRITQIEYNPTATTSSPQFQAGDYEFLELKNVGNEPVALTGLRLSGGVEFVYDGGRISWLPPLTTAYVVRNAMAFQHRHGYHHTILGEFDGQLGNGGNSLRLFDSVGELVLSFSYVDSWFPETDGGGRSLVAVNESAEWSEWNQKQQWRPSRNRGGDVQDHWLSTLLAGVTNPFDLRGEADPDHDGYSNAEEFIAGTHPQSGSSVPKLRVDPLPNRGVRLRFTMPPNRSCALESSHNPTGQWSALRIISAAQDERLIEVDDPPSLGQNSRYYRLRIPALSGWVAP